MKKSAEAIRVVVIDDHPVVREGVAAMIQQQPDMCVVGEAGNGVDGLDLCDRHSPDIVLLDLELGRMSGLEVLSVLRRSNSFVQVLILTTYGFEEDIYTAVQGGAAGYLFKDASREELLTAIRRVHEGQKFFPPAVSAKLAARLTGETPTPREREVLRWLAEGLANKEISERLGVGEATVKTHVNGLMQKLQSASRTEAVTRARQKGWIR